MPFDVVIGRGPKPSSGPATNLVVGAFAQTNTTATDQGDADMINWASGKPWVYDALGKIFVWVQYLDPPPGTNTKYHVPVVSNDGGSTWSEPARTSFQATQGEILNVRCSFCHDPTHDLFVCLLILTQADGGVYVRFYQPTRDGSGNITGMTRVRQLSIEPGVAGMTFEAPVAEWCADVGKVLLTWGALNGAHAGVKAVMRATSRVVSGDANDVVAANWLAPLNENAGAGATDPIASSLNVTRVSTLAQSATSAMIYGSVLRMASKDLSIVYCTGGGTSGTFRYNRATWSAANSDWRTGLAAALASDSGQTVLSAINRTATAGYGNKDQLLGQLTEDAGGNLGVGFPTYNGGDTWTVCTVDPTGTRSALVDVYNAGGTHSYAPCGDFFWDATAARWVATYIKTTTQFSYYQLLDAGLVVKKAETGLDTSHPIDLPYGPPRGARLNNKTLFLERDTTVRTAPSKFFAWVASGAWS